MTHQLAELNVGRFRGADIHDPIMKEFADNLDKINALAESYDGFIWRLKDENNNATAFNPYEDERIAVNMSVWRNIESLENFAYKSGHVDFLRRKREWFENFGSAYLVLWWIPIDTLPTLKEAIARLDYLQLHGSTLHAFTFKNQFEPSVNVVL